MTITPRLKESVNFLELSYSELEERNLAIKRERMTGKSSKYFETKFLDILTKEKAIKAVTVCFSDMEGRFHMLDYNKIFLLSSHDNLTFDGSSIKGFTPQHSSDLCLHIDWSSFRWLPADIFGHGKVLVFANVHDRNGKPYIGDYRSNLALLSAELAKKEKITVNVAPEIEGIIIEGENAEQNFDEREGFELASKGGYFNVLPQDTLRQFIDRLAEATRALGFENEKDHPEVAPSQFEMNYRYTEMVQAADQVQLYKVIARQLAKNIGLTASFLPKPRMNINGSGMHTNMSLTKNGKNIFYDAKGKHSMSQLAHDFITGILYYASEICLGLNSSVNAYRRLDPKFEAPNEIKVSPSDRSAMIRIPFANAKSSRIEVRTVAPDANPYLAFYLILRAGLKGIKASSKEKKIYTELYQRPAKKLPKNIDQALRAFKKSEFIKEAMLEE
ncbi:glutamine synthetase, partial [Candidatus Peregrinibacteria bacterium]|nr:glutamine synthetase [Candidatus Peregrinibacteria bacterium]